MMGGTKPFDKVTGNGKGRRHPGYVPLVVHSVFSKGALTVEEWVKGASERGLRYVSLCDKRRAFGWGRLESASRVFGINPLFGITFHFMGGSLVLFLKEKEGYTRLVQFFHRGSWEDDLPGLLGIFIPRSGSIPKGLKDAFDPGDFYLGATLDNFRIVGEMVREGAERAVWAQPVMHLNQPERFLLLKSLREKIPYPRVMTRYRERVPLYGLLPMSYILKVTGGDAFPWLKTTFEVAEKLQVALKGLIPPLPGDLFKKTLREVAWERYREKFPEPDQRTRARLEYELDTIEGSGFGSYFLLVTDLVDFASSRGIFHNLKGSGASSLVAYVLGISRVNPLKYGLYFERFLNPGRSDPPDIDIDLDSRRRDEVVRYLFDNYRDRIGLGMLAAFKKYGARSALYDVARALGYSPSESRSLSVKAPFEWEPRDIVKMRPPEGYNFLWRMVPLLQNVFKEVSLHVGGILLTPPPREAFLFLEPSPKGYPLAHFDRDDAEDFGLIKLDLLSVRGLSALSDSLGDLDNPSIPEDDPETWEMIREGRTMGCFQIESPGMMALLRRIKPDNIDDLTMALALIRPGPTKIGMKEKALGIRDGKLSPDPLLGKLLPETGGIFLYEEQVMQLSERMCGFSPGEGERLRRALKRKENLEPWRDRFFRGALRKGFSLKDTERVWELLSHFSSYSFNKAHSVSYAWVAYRSAYLRRHSPLEYFKGVLNAEGGYYALNVYVEEARRWGVRILPPDVERSGKGWEIQEGGLRVGLKRVSNLSYKTMEKILKERQGRSFRSLEDFLKRVRPSRKEALSLSGSGALDSLEPNRSTQLLKILGGRGKGVSLEDYTPEEKEKETWKVLGFPLNQHPLGYAGDRPPLRISNLSDYDGEKVTLALRLIDFRLKEVPKGKKAFLLFDDETGTLQGVASRNIEVPESLYLLVKGRIISQDGMHRMLRVERMEEIRIE